MRNSDLAGDYAPYYDWLMDLVGGEEWWGHCEEAMLRVFERKYYWTNPIDGNIQSHIENLRAEALSDMLAIYIPIGEPSVLEVLVYLAREDEIDHALDEFLSGERMLGPGKLLWNQAQMLFLKQFEVESG